MTIDGVNIDNYLLQNIDNGIEYIKADTGNTSDGSYYENIIAKKKMLKLSIKPLSLTDFATFMAIIRATDEHTIVYTEPSTNTSYTGVFCLKSNPQWKNVGGMFIKDLVVDLKEI